MNTKIKNRAKNFADLLAEKEEVLPQDLLVAVEYCFKNSTLSFSTFERMMKAIKSEKFNELILSLLKQNENNGVKETAIHCVYEVVNFAYNLSKVIDGKPGDEKVLETSAKILLSFIRTEQKNREQS